MVVLIKKVGSTLRYFGKVIYSNQVIKSYETIIYLLYYNNFIKFYQIFYIIY